MMNRFLKQPKNDVVPATVSTQSEDDDVCECIEVVDSNACNATKRPKGFSKVWKYFSKSADKKLAKCLQCGKEYKTSGNTSNLLDHLRRFHPNIEKEEEKSFSSSSSSSRQSSIRSVDSYFKRAVQYDSSAQRKKDIDAALVSFVALDLQPFNIVANTGFRKLINVLDPRYVIPSANNLRDCLIRNQYQTLKIHLEHALSSVNHVSLTCDCWTSAANEGYLTITCHFIDKSMCLRSAVLSTNKLQDATNHQSQNLANSLKTVIDEWKIANKVECIVTDNERAIVKACELLQKKHLPCYAHTLNLAVQDALKPNHELQRILNKCKTIVTFFKSSTVAYEKFKRLQDIEKPYSLIQETPTRWNSTYFMIQRIIKTNEHVSQVLLETKKAPAPLTADEVCVLEETERLLKILQDATEHVSGGTYVTISSLIPLSFGISDKLASIDSTLTTMEAKKLSSALFIAAKERLGHYENRTIPRIATLLDPRFKKEGFASRSNIDQAVLYFEKEVADICAHMKTSETTDFNSSADSASSSLLDFVDKRVAGRFKTSRSDAILMLRRYFEIDFIKKDADPLQFWKITGEEFDAIKQCVNKYFCIPGTSVESERMFSKAGRIITDRRTCLKPKNVNMLLFMNKNEWLNAK